MSQSSFLSNPKRSWLDWLVFLPGFPVEIYLWIPVVTGGVVPLIQAALSNPEKILELPENVEWYKINNLILACITLGVALTRVISIWGYILVSRRAMGIYCLCYLMYFLLHGIPLLNPSAWLFHLHFLLSLFLWFCRWSTRDDSKVEGLAIGLVIRKFPWIAWVTHPLTWLLCAVLAVVSAISIINDLP